MTPKENQKYKYKTLEPLLLAVSMVIGMFLGYNLFDNKNDLSLLSASTLDPSSSGTGMGRIEEIIRVVENSYVDVVDSENISLKAIEAIVQQLDPHSSYISADELEEYNQKMQGKHKGIGIESKFIEDSLYVNYVVPESNAEKAGIKPGDVILRIEDDTLVNKNRNIKFVQELLRKTENGSLEFEVLSSGAEKFSKKIALTEIESQSASSHYVIDNNHGYIKIKRFSANTYDQFFKSLESISEKAGKDEFNLILDLRDNPGGFVPQTLRILSQLFPTKDRVLSFTEGEHRKRKEYKSSGRNFYKVKNLVVLINENSASASEIIAGAVQDWDRGVLIGQATYGKGLVQEIFPLKTGGAIRLTVARYATPSGRFIQKPYEIQNDAQLQADSTFYTKKLKRKIQNNGGIIPDLEMEMNQESEYNSEITDYVCQRILPGRSAIDLEKLMDENIPLPFEITDKFGSSIRKIRAELIYSWYGKKAYYEYFQKRDPLVLKAIEILSKDDPVKRLASNEF